MDWKFGIKLSSEHYESSALRKAVEALEQGRELIEGIVPLEKSLNESYSLLENQLGWFLQKAEWVYELEKLVEEWKTEFKKERGLADDPRFITWLARRFLANKPDWVRMGNPDYEFGNYIWVDDGCTMGVLHPKVPKIVVGILDEISKEDFVRKVWNGYFCSREFEGAEVVGQSASNTCPRCGGFLESFATRQRIHYQCKCGYNASEENLASLAD